MATRAEQDEARIQTLADELRGAWPSHLPEMHESCNDWCDLAVTILDLGYRKRK